MVELSVPAASMSKNALTCACDPDTTFSLFSFALTRLSVYPTLALFAVISDACPEVIVVGLSVILLYDTWDEPLITPSASNFAFTNASVYPTLAVFAVIADAWAPLIVVTELAKKSPVFETAAEPKPKFVLAVPAFVKSDKFEALANFVPTVVVKATTSESPFAILEEISNNVSNASPAPPIKSDTSLCT